MNYEEQFFAALKSIGHPQDETGTADTTMAVPVSRRNLFVHHETHPVVFDTLLKKRYETDWCHWEPSTLWHTIKADFNTQTISEHNKSKIQALRTLHLNQWYWTHWEVFGWITQSVNGSLPDFQVIQKPTVSQLMNSVDVANKVRPGESFAEEVKIYVAACMIDNDVFYAPDPIGFCQEHIDKYLTEHGFQHVLDILPKVKDKYAAVAKLSDAELASAPGHLLQENPVDVQVARLKVAADYLDLRHRQLAEQLKVI